MLLPKEDISPTSWREQKAKKKRICMVNSVESDPVHIMAQWHWKIPGRGA
jgi:hypothetical protein